MIVWNGMDLIGLFVSVVVLPLIYIIYIIYIKFNK